MAFATSSQNKKEDARHHVFPDADPAHSAAEVLRKGHAADCVAGQFGPHGVPHAEFLPDGDANLVVLAEVLPERRESRLVRASAGSGESGGRWWQLAAVAFVGGRAREVRLAVEARLARHARGDGDAVDGEVHLGVGRAEVDLLDARTEQRVGVDGERQVVHESDRAAGGGGGGEERNGAREARLGREDVRVEDPDEVVLRCAVGPDQVVDLWVDADNFLTCSSRIFLRQLRRAFKTAVPRLANDEFCRDAGIAGAEFLDDGDGCVGFVGDGKDDFKVGVVLPERGFEVLVQVAVESPQGSQDGHGRDRVCGWIEGRRRGLRSRKPRVTLLAARRLGLAGERCCGSHEE